jgi:hypothetical protein
MSYDIVWEFRVPSASRSDFEKAYGPDGPWAALFRKATAFIEVRLLRCSEHDERYLTIDRWDTQAAFDSFRCDFAEEYELLDTRLAGLTSSETRIGAFFDSGN